ncbi:MAG: DUF4301 family protein [Flavobacteriaceae bacterium]
MKELSAKELQQISEHGLSREQLFQQLEIFRNGIPYVQLERPATLLNGILNFTVQQEKERIDTFDKSLKKIHVTKFVPASGAATRMFKSLFSFLEEYKPYRDSIDSFAERSGDTNLKELFENHGLLPFNDELESIDVEMDNSESDIFFERIKAMLDPEEMDFASYPKGLLPFHKYNDHVATAFEEHLKEGMMYARSGDEVDIHFTISAQHLEKFRSAFKLAEVRLSEADKVNFNISYSYQRPSTDTVAVSLDNEPFKNNDGSLLFRPGGHGALIENLDELDADIIFIKNIDNVVVPGLAEEVTKYKKILAGHLLTVQKKTFEYAKLIDDEDLNGDQMQEIKTFLEEELNVRFLDKYYGFSIAEQIEILKDKINRPIRVCGMVKNEGEPGGGPFWIKDQYQHVSLQIIESAQVNSNHPEQMKIFQKSTHFNPVDIVCGVKDYKGDKFKLVNYVDPNMGFITEKTQNGRELKALELPGLWNGAMAFWNTIFVEVPLETFNPVKTVNDLLRPSHQVG